MSKCIVETRIGSTWENVWTDGNDVPLEFASRRLALMEIDDLILGTDLAYEKGYLSERYSRDNYRVVRKP